MLQSNKIPAQENNTMTKPINWNKRKYTQQQFEQAWQQAETLYEGSMLRAHHSKDHQEELQGSASHEIDP